VIKMGSASKGFIERSRIKQFPDLSGLNLMHAKYVTHCFPKHSHDCFGVGVVEQGALNFYYRGENCVASSGEINTVNPGEVHTGAAAGESGWMYRMFYFDADLLQHFCNEMADRVTSLPSFRSGVIRDNDLAMSIRDIHVKMLDGYAGRLERETLLLKMFSRLVRQYASDPPACKKIGAEPTAVRRAVEYLDAHFSEDISVSTVAAVACVSPYHFIRVFSRHTGLTPHAWLMQVRIHKAQGMLRHGLGIGQVAAATGFADQSHLSRVFKRILGYTPGQFSNCVQYAKPSQR